MSQGDPQPVRYDLPPVNLEGGGDSPDVQAANLQAVLPSPGYPTTILMLADAITKRADLVLMDFTPNSISIRYQVDGIWHNMPAMDRASGDYMLATLKQLSNMDYRERRQRQSGKFVAEYMRSKHKCKITSQGIATGERVVLEVGRERPPTDTLEDIGMRDSMREEFISILNSTGGIVLVSALPGDGFSTTWRAAMNSSDRFMRDIFVIEEKTRVEPEVINVSSMTYDESAGETPLAVMRSLMLREPNVVAFAEIPNADVLNEMSRLALHDDKMIYGRLHAKHAVEAVLRALLLKPEVSMFADALKAVLCQRILRILCDECRQEFRPNPALIAQLGLPPDRVPTLYTHFQPRPEDLVDARGNALELEPCKKCGGPGYFERTAIFELLVIDDRFRQAMRDEPTVQKLSKVAEQSGHVSLRDEGIVSVAKGQTSLEELQRVLKK